VESDVIILKVFRRKSQLKSEKLRCNLISDSQENTTMYLRKILVKVHLLHHSHHHHLHHHVAIMEFGHLFTPPSITHPEVASVVLPGPSCLLVCTSNFPQKNRQAKGSKAYEDLPCSGLVTHSWEILTTGKVPQ
jgi:hypothetical protein